jgi:hypothetical protein
MASHVQSLDGDPSLLSPSQFMGEGKPKFLVILPSLLNLGSRLASKAMPLIGKELFTSPSLTNYQLN